MEELKSGIPLLFQQTFSLIKKNLILAWNSKVTTFLQLFSSFFFIAILVGIQKALDYRVKNPSLGPAVTDPVALVNPPIPACEEKFFIKLPCYDFVWSGSGNEKFSSVVNRIMANNPGRPIPQNKVKSFERKEDMHKWLLANPMRVPGALHFFQTNQNEMRFGIQTNTSSYVNIGRQTEDPVFKYQIPLHHAASREIFRYLVGDSEFPADIGIKEFPHPEKKHETSGPISSSLYTELFDLMFFYAVVMFGFIFQINSLVQEKELKLRQMMNVMGLYDTAYWCSWFVYEGVMALLTSLLILGFGSMFQMDLFKKNDPIVVFFLFFLFALSMVGFAFFISTLISKSSSTPSIGFSIFLVGFVTMLFSEAFYDKNMAILYRILWSLFPPNPFGSGLRLLMDASASSQYDMRWSNQAKQCLDHNTNPCFTIYYFFMWLVSTFILWSVLAVYFDNILPDAVGVKKPLLYFAMPSYWMGSGDKKNIDINILGPSSTTDEDVLEEEQSVKEAARQGITSPDVAVQLRGLSKTYDKKLKLRCRKCCCCCCICACKMTKRHDAVKDLWMNFPKNQLFCLLGPNGAGKTTAISCLTGVTPVTHGDAIVYGNSILSSNERSKIRRILGVCAQFDSLWNGLSGKQHLELFASIKGLPRTSCKLEAQKLLADVKMDKVANVGVGSYSGGMKRRISLAIALIGNPKLVILDEPTTGMDPVTRRHVWNLIEKAKQGRTIILTTHSMTEAEILSDRIGIMAKGRLRCIGTSTMLKSRFGTGYNVKVTFFEKNNNGSVEGVDSSGENRESVKMFFKQYLNITPQEENDSLLTFVVPNDKEEELADFFQVLESRCREFGIKNIQLGMGTLEEVFLSIAKKAAQESPEERLTTVNLPSGTSLQVPFGAKYVGIPGTNSAENPRGLMVEVTWKQDENGELCVSSHSTEKAVPPGLRPVVSSTVASARSAKGPAKGIVLE